MPLIKITTFVLLVFGTYLAVRWVDFAAVLNPERVVAYLNSTGSFAPAVFILIMASSVVISPIPSLPLDLAAGAAFGVPVGTTYAVLGAEIGAILSFLIGRALGREALARLWRRDITFCEGCSDRHLALIVFVARLVPIFSFDLISYGAGLTNMSLRAFAIATLFGMIPPTFALTYAGSSVVSGEWLLFLLGLIMVAFFLLVPKLVIQYPSSWWVRLLRGEAPLTVKDQIIPVMPVIAGTQADESAQRCSSCGGPME